MLEHINTALSFLEAILNSALGVLAPFFINLFPDADMDLVGSIHGWGSAMSGFQTSFNVFYFVDMGVVSLMLAVTTPVIIAYFIFHLVVKVLEVVHNLADSIPIIG